MSNRQSASSYNKMLDKIFSGARPKTAEGESRTFDLVGQVRTAHVTISDEAALRKSKNGRIPGPWGIRTDQRLSLDYVITHDDKTFERGHVIAGSVSELRSKFHKQVSQRPEPLTPELREETAKAFSEMQQRIDGVGYNVVKTFRREGNEKSGIDAGL